MSKLCFGTLCGRPGREMTNKQWNRSTVRATAICHCRSPGELQLCLVLFDSIRFCKLDIQDKLEIGLDWIGLKAPLLNFTRIG